MSNFVFCLFYLHIRDNTNTIYNNTLVNRNSFIRRQIMSIKYTCH